LQELRKVEDNERRSKSIGRYQQQTESIERPHARNESRNVGTNRTVQPKGDVEDVFAEEVGQKQVDLSAEEICIDHSVPITPTRDDEETDTQVTTSNLITQVNQNNEEDVDESYDE